MVSEYVLADRFVRLTVKLMVSTWSVVEPEVGLTVSQVSPLPMVQVSSPSPELVMVKDRNVSDVPKYCGFSS